MQKLNVEINTPIMLLKIFQKECLKIRENKLWRRRKKKRDHRLETFYRCRIGKFETCKACACEEAS